MSPGKRASGKTPVSDPAPQGRLWVRLMKKHRISKSAMTPCTRDDPQAALRVALPPMDVGQPLWLPRHQADWESYALTRFTAEHFVEPFPYDAMEISYLFPEDEAKPGRKRNPLEDA